MTSWAKIKKRLIAFSLIFLISFLGVFVFGPEQAKAGPCNILSGFDGTTCVLSIGLGVLNQVIKLFGSALNLALNLLKELLNWGGFIETDIVKIGWKIMRDLANMLFVLILMAIAFATILRLETYGMKALLPKLIIAALLINFSLVLSGVIVDFAQVVTDFFLSQAGGDDFQANMMNATQAIKALAIRNDVSLGTGIVAMGNVFVGALLTVIFLLIIFFVFASYAVLLVVRVVALWFLLILSPIVWMFWILPASRALFSKWWTNFIKWSFFAPVSAFFLFLAIFSYQSLLTTSIAEALRNNDYSKLLPSFTEPANLLQYLLVIGILLGGLMAAQQMGIAGASGAMGVAKFFGKGAAGFANRWLARREMPGATGIGKGISKLSEKFKGRMPELAARLETAGKLVTETKGKGMLSPGAWKMAWVKRRQRAEAESYSEGVGSLEDVLDYAYSGGKEYHNRQYRATLGLAQQKLKELKETGDTSQPQLIKSVKAGLRQGGIGGKAEVMGAMWQLFAQADEEGLMADKELGKPYNYKTDPINIQDFIKKNIGKGDNEKRFAASLGNVARLAGIPQYDGLTETDPETGQTEWTDKGKIGVTGAIQASKIWPQNKARILARRSYGVEDETTGKFDGLHTAGKELLRRISLEDVNEVKNIPTFTKQWLVEGEKRGEYLRNFADEIENGYATDYKTEEGTMGYAPNKQKADMLRKWMGQLEKQIPSASIPEGESKIVPPTEEALREARGRQSPRAFG